jgi:hypothetical protein
MQLVVDNKCLQVKNFKYPGCVISYENENDFQQTLAELSQILGILNDTFKPTLVQEFARLNT